MTKSRTLKPSSEITPKTTSTFPANITTIHRKDIPLRIKNPFPNAEYIWPNDLDNPCLAYRLGRAWRIRNGNTSQIFESQVEVLTYIHEKTGSRGFNISDYPNDPSYIKPTRVNPDPTADMITVTPKNNSNSWVGRADRIDDGWVAELYGDTIEKEVDGLRKTFHEVIATRQFKTERGAIQWFAKMRHECDDQVWFWSSDFGSNDRTKYQLVW